MGAFDAKPVISVRYDNPYESLGLCALFKGESGAGKSVGALSFPDPLVLDFDRKMPAIARKHFPGKRVGYVQFDDIFQLADFINDNRNWPETLIADSLTSLVKLILHSIAEMKGESTPKMLQKIKQTAGKGQMIELMGIDYYNGETRFISWFLNALKELHMQTGNPKNVILTAHVITTESAPDLKTKLVTKTRSIVTEGRKVASYVPTQFDDAWLFGLEKPDLGSESTRPRHIVLTEALGDDTAKTAYHLPWKIDFTDGSLYDLIKGKLSISSLNPAANTAISTKLVNKGD